MSKVGEFNIVFPQELDRKVSMKVTKQTIKETLEDICTLYDYRYEYKSNSIVFLNKKFETRLRPIYLKYKSATLVLNKLKELKLKDLEIKKDPALNNLIVSGKDKDIAVIQDYIENIDIAPTQRVFLPEFLKFKDIQRYLKNNLDEKADIEVKRLQQDYVLISGPKKLANDIYKQLEKIDQPVPDQAFSIQVFRLSEINKYKLSKIDSSFQKKTLFRTKKKDIDLDDFELVNSQSLKLSPNLSAPLYELSFEFSKDILDPDVIGITYNEEEVFFHKKNDQIIYFLSKQDIQKQSKLKKTIGLESSADTIIVIKTISDKDFENNLEIQVPEESIDIKSFSEEVIDPSDVFH